MSQPAPSILQAIEDPELFGPYFRNRETWSAWLVFLCALFALPMTAEQRDLYTKCTGRSEPPGAPMIEGWLICGRRAGKSFIIALIAVYLAVFRSYTEHLGPGERATILIIASDRRQARVIFRYIRGLLVGVPLLAGLIERETSDTLDLSNNVSIEVGTASYRSTRGYSYASVLCDEVAFWPSDDAASPDYEILDAIRPGMATIPGAMLLCASSPYSKRGALWDTYRRAYGKDDPEVLVWKAPTRTMNPRVPQSVIDRAMERDPVAASAEFGAEFRTDLEGFVPREVVDAVVSPGVYERPALASVRYCAFVDPSGGSSDSMTIAIAHREGQVDILDAVRERQAPFSPQDVVAEFAELCRRYGISRVQGERYGGEWPREAFRMHGISYDLSKNTKSQIYQALLPRLNSGEVDLLDNPRLHAQLIGLERRTSRGGRDSIDHAPGSHDDLANAAAGALLAAGGVNSQLVSVTPILGLY